MDLGSMLIAGAILVTAVTSQVYDASFQQACTGTGPCTVNVQSRDANKEELFQINFEFASDEPCYNPRVSLSFAETDFGNPDVEYLDLYYPSYTDDDIISRCHGNSDGSGVCSTTYAECLNGFPLGIASATDLSFTLYKTDQIGAFCTIDGISYALYGDLTISCSDAACQTTACDVNDRVDTLNNDVSLVTGRVSTLETDVNTLEGDVNTAESEIDTLQSKVNALETTGINRPFDKTLTQPFNLNNGNTFTINAFSDLSGVEELILVEFTFPHGQVCNNPILSVKFEDIDFSTASTEYLDLYYPSYPNGLIAKCYGTTDANCDQFIQCINDYHLGVASVNSIGIVVLKTDQINTFCGSDVNGDKRSLNADFTLTCGSDTIEDRFDSLVSQIQSVSAAKSIGYNKFTNDIPNNNLGDNGIIFSKADILLLFMNVFVMMISIYACYKAGSFSKYSNLKYIDTEFEEEKSIKN